MSRYFFTFGQAYNLANSYVVVEADTAEEARRQFTTVRADLDEMAGRCYAFSYDERDFAGQAERWGLSEIPIDAPIWRQR